MVRKLAKTAFFIGLVAVIALSLLPQETLPETGLWDKWNHTLAYGVLALSGGVGFQGWRSMLMVGIGLVALGAGLELAQSVTPDRDGSIYDALANLIGVAIGSAATIGTNTLIARPIVKFGPR
jgi:VanZ family protein